MSQRLRHFFVFLIASFTAATVQSAPPSATSPPSLEDFLKKQAFDLLHRRKVEVAALKTPEQIEERKKALRNFLLTSLGDLPERTPLNTRVVQVRSNEGFHIEKIVFESRPNHHVTAILYLPEGKNPCPGVLVPCGHSANGKAAETYQRMCILLARNGIAAFCYDPIGQGERVQKLDSQGAPAIREGSTTEHTMAGIGAMLVGRQAASYRVWDGFRALDYLASRPEIDPKRLGCTGNSGGGTLTSYLMALDDRITVAAPSCYITSLERLFATIGPQDAEQNITGQVAAGLDHADYVWMRAPKPTLLCVGTQDFFDIQGSWDTFREVKLLYGRLGFGERVDLFESDEPHGLTGPRRVASARWFSRWLLHRDEPITEADSSIASDPDLQCTRTGQVLSDFKGVSVFDLNARREEELRPDRAAFSRRASQPEFRARVRELLAISTPHPAVVPLVVERTSGVSPFQIRKLRLETEPGILISATEMIPSWPDEREPVMVRLGEQDPIGSNEPSATRRRPLQDLAMRGRRVVIANLRGLGPIEPRGEKPSWTREPLVNESFLSLHIGRPLLGQWTMELLNLLETLRAQYPSERFPGFELVASGPSALAALHAAVLDERGSIRALTLEKSVISWAGVVQSGISRGQLADVVPGVLKSYDLPDLAARLEPLPLTIRQPLDPVGAPAGLADLRAAYASCVQAYGSGGKLVLEASH